LADPIGAAPTVEQRYKLADRYLGAGMRALIVDQNLDASFIDNGNGILFRRGAADKREILFFDLATRQPVAIDMPPLHTHHIENLSDCDVVTFFWAHRHFDPRNSDTFAEPVLRRLA